MQGAHSRGIPYLQLLPFQRLWQYGWGKNGLTLKQAALDMRYVDEPTFDRIVRAERMLGPSEDEF